VEQNGHLRAKIWGLIEGSVLAMSETFVKKKFKKRRIGIIMAYSGREG
jgi:hypothetical protein